MNHWAARFPYIRDRKETPEQQIARLRAEHAVVAAARPPYQNDNRLDEDPDESGMWWQRD